MSFSVRAPASSANLGPGFDCLGLALDRWLTVDVTIEDAPGIRDAGSPDLLGGSNLVIDAMRIAADRFALRLPGCMVRVTSEIPVARGLGSSAAAIVAGLKAACAAAEQSIADPELVDLAGAIEGHADNASAAVLGGVTVSIYTPAGYLAEVLARSLPWIPVAFVPDSHSLTHEARGLLPGAVPMPDAVTNVGRAAMLAYALQHGRSDLLREAMIDRLHQPYRARIFPHLEPAMSAALAAGAAGACLSGAGPTVLAFTDPAIADAVGLAMEAAARGTGIAGRAVLLSVPERGCHIVGATGERRV
jgi:homoserine kinase